MDYSSIDTSEIKNALKSYTMAADALDTAFNAGKRASLEADSADSAIISRNANAYIYAELAANMAKHAEYLARIAQKESSRAHNIADRYADLVAGNRPLPCVVEAEEKIKSDSNLVVST